jgi:hypothetical protein
VEKLKELDRKILIGAGLTVAFLILWLVTLPSVSYRNTINPYSDLNESQKYDYSINDTNNYNRAILMQDNTFCEYIINTTMKKDCKANSPNPAEVAHAIDTPAIKNQDDINNYNRAILMQDKSFCNEISDEQMKKECLEYEG